MPEHDAPTVERTAEPISDLTAEPTWDHTADRTADFTAERSRIDRIDDSITELVRQRLEVSLDIQRRRVAAGGNRTAPAREEAVVHRYRSTLGPRGGELARALLGLCRG
jgi:monofunctional chorismate mutase